MKTCWHTIGTWELKKLAASLLVAFAGSASAAVLYVDANGANATPPYTNWATAAANIQVAADAAALGDQIVVTNGVYAGGVIIAKALGVQSVNGPQFTTIAGGGPCVSLASNTSLSGFTVTGGSSSAGGGVYCASASAVVSNCVVTGNRASGAGGGAYQGTLINCTLNSNSAHLSGNYSATYGGGAYGCTLNNCTLDGNSAEIVNDYPASMNNSAHGGGAYGCTLNNCTVANNCASTLGAFCLGFGICDPSYYYIEGAADGGGVANCTLSNCALIGNSAWNSYYDYDNLDCVHYAIHSMIAEGGAASHSTLNNCTLSGNSTGNSSYFPNRSVPIHTDSAGGGAYDCRLTNSTLTGNSAPNGGGAAASTLAGCTLTTNWASYGGGTSDGWLTNCTLTGNSAANSGGGAFGSALNNSTLSSNSASSGGGGADGGTLNNCTLTGNSAAYGGGAYLCTLNNCTVTGNLAQYGGGCYWHCALNNSIIYFNTAPVGANYAISSIMNYCCTTPLPTNGLGNITNAPLFVDTNGWADLHLQSNSPCINAGDDAYAPAGPDLDGNPRIKGTTVDIGAYEFQTPASIISYAWLQQYGLITDGSADFADPDHDGLNNWQEWVCGTDPTNALSALRMLAPVRTGTNVTVTWQSVAGVNYFLERSTNLAASPVFVPAVTNVFGQAGTTSFSDTNAIGSGPWFYRVGVSGQ